MEEGYTQFFKKNPDMKLEVSVDSVRFVSQDNAILEGAARSYKTGKAGEPTLSRIGACTSAKRGSGCWRCCRESPDEGTTLADVDWLIGTWESKSDAADVRTTYEWEDGKNSIRARFTIKEKDQDEVLSGTQLIGRAAGPASCTRGCSRATAASARPTGPGTARRGPSTQPASNRTATMSRQRTC